mgnify:FL=1
MSHPSVRNLILVNTQEHKKIVDGRIKEQYHIWDALVNMFHVECSQSGYIIQSKILHLVKCTCIDFGRQTYHSCLSVFTITISSGTLVKGYNLQLKKEDL